MLTDAESIGQKYAREVAKLPPPSLAPQNVPLLSATPTWLILDLSELAAQPGKTVLETLGSETFWQILQDLRISGLWLKNLKAGGSARIGFEIDPKWGGGWSAVKEAAASRGTLLIGDCVGAATGPGLDFELALQNVSEYTEMYHLIEIDRKDFHLLPKVPVGMSFANVSWLELEGLYKKGYVPQEFRPYVKESSWNATPLMRSLNGQGRRFIYLKENENDPLFAWLSPSFAAEKILSADALDSVYRLSQKGLFLDASIPRFAKETASLWIRKIGGYSVASTNGTIAELKTAPADIAVDAPTQAALLHALIAEDAEALRLIYKLYLQEGISLSRLAHILEPIERFPCDWTEFLLNPKKQYQYLEEKITGELLRDRLLREDLYKLRESLLPGSTPVLTWGGACALAFGAADPKDFQKKQDLIQKAHLLLAFTYAMQPGVFCLSASDLVGALPEVPKAPIDLFGPNRNALYPSLPCQLQNPKTFASELKKIVAVRSSSKIAAGELVDVCPVDTPGTLLLLHRLPDSRFFHLLAVNFSRSPVQEKIKLPGLEDTWAIDLMTGLSAPKGFESGLFFFELPPLSGKVFLFQPKYYD
jgi:trehalose synthase